ncbi:MAG: hypothetical protein LBF80_07415 [Spirochaetaceae bacterium]|nr:hypothetical protein [Spirochaetaceae bacterium]
MIYRCVFIFVILLFSNSCFAEREAGFSLVGAGGETYPLYTASNELDGVFSLSKTKNYEYTLNESVRVPRNYSLEIDYSLVDQLDAGTADGGDYQVTVRIDNDFGWILPRNLDFLAMSRAGERIRYAIPLQTARIKRISLEVSGVKKTGVEMRLNGLRLTERFYGFDAEGGPVLTSPFTRRDYDGTAGRVLINPDGDYEIGGGKVLFIDGIEGAPEITAGGNTFRYIANNGEDAYRGLTVPAAFLETCAIEINGSVEAALLKPSQNKSPPEPINADPAFILMYPQDKWRNRNYEVFRWESFPSILIFDTASYDLQDKIFKRLAFFAEKKGFRGRLAKDVEIAELHGWNAHDYSAETLAEFFDAARKSSFPLLDEELELRDILVQANIVKDRGGDFVAGDGAVISISRESAGYLRLMFMTHEAFHGIFFIDAYFREFCKRRWDNLDKAAKRFITSYFDFQQYDITDPLLVVNEFMGHCLQQGVSASGKYFGEDVANRLYEKSPWRRAALPPRDEESGTWPGIAESFKKEAAAFSEYVSTRWGLSAGRVWRVRL